MILDLYSGARGWSEGLRMLGLSDVGIELDAAACATAAAAGHATIRADVASYPLDHLAGRVEGVLGGPPCQSFSSAGKGEGRVQLARLVAAVHAGAWDAVDPTRAAGYGHVLEVGRWVETLRPEWAVCEQVPEVLPVWRAYADRWRAQGWSAWAGILCAADYGVPQERYRAFLIARRDGRRVAPPAPTHAEHPDTLFGVMPRWVTMAAALGWAGENVGRPARTLCGDRSPRWLYPDRDGTHGEIIRPERRVDPPDTYCSECATYDPRGARPGPWHKRPCSMYEDVALNRRQQTDGVPVRLVPTDEPAPTLTGIAGAKGQWVWERPATTLVGDARVFGPHSGSAGEPQSANSVALTLPEALILQGFDPAYPVQGNKSQRVQQVGNACPPPLAAHVVAAATGRTLALEETAA